MNIIHATEGNFHELVSKDIVLVDFFATWCGPCKMLGPVLESIASDRSSVKVVKVDVDECESIARSYGIMSVPTLYFFKDGKVVDSKIGFMSEMELNNWIESIK